MTDAAWRRGLLVPSAFAFAAFAVLVALGTWQVERKAWKETAIDTVTERFATPAVPLAPLAEWAKLSAQADEFRRVAVAAEFLHDKEALVYTTGSTLRSDAAGPGYWVFTPARVAGGMVMVNRGFVPEGRQSPASRQQGQVAGRIDVVGVLRWPEAPGFFTPNSDPAKNLWFHRDPAAMAAAKGLAGAVAPFYIEQESPAVPGGLPQVGTLRPNLPNNHLGYAITWYGLALMLAGVFAAWLLARRRGAAVLVQNSPPD